MLEQLYISNIAVIERASIDLGAGFTVLTGETGAGKSIIIDSIHAVLGERASKDLLRSGEERASVSALFTSLSKETLDFLGTLSIPREEGDTLLVQREIRAEGRGGIKCNGAPVTASMLREIGRKLINIHGQHESYELLSPEVHLNYIDEFGGLKDLLSKYQASYRALRDTRKELESLREDEGEKARRTDLLKYQIEELEAAGIEPGEREELTRRRDLIKNSERISGILERVRGLLGGEEDSGGALAGVSQSADELEKAARYLPELGVAAERARDAQFLLEDVDSALQGVSADFDPGELEEIEDRLDLLYRLGLKYGDTEEKMLAFLENCREELHRIEFSDELREKLEGDYERERDEAVSLARELSQKRRRSAEDFALKVKEELRFLNMPGVEFLPQIERVPLYAMGCDRIQFLVSANTGEEPRPMSKIASGGELSRIMLAIKTVLSGMDGVDTLIFDEVDSGVSGAAAAKVGQKLKEVSKNRQVLCVTHLAQIASLADNHLRVLKTVEGDRTYTRVERLDFEGRKRELARIIGGDNITELQLKMADEMLSAGDK